MSAIIPGRAAILVTTKIIIKNRCEATALEAVRGTNIGRWTNDGVERSKKKVSLT